MRFYAIDPHADNYPGLSPYLYCGNDPINLIDPTSMDWYDINSEITWNEGSDDVEIPGDWGALARTLGIGGYAKSLGENVLVVTGGTQYGDHVEEGINEATFELYTPANKEGPTATAKGNTISGDQELFATIAPGLYEAYAKENYGGKGYRGLKLKGDIPFLYENTAHMGPLRNEKAFTHAQGVDVHAGAIKGEVLSYIDRNDGYRKYISKACPTIEAGNRDGYNAFMEYFKGWRGNVYLRRKKPMDVYLEDLKQNYDANPYYTY